MDQRPTDATTRTSSPNDVRLAIARNEKILGVNAAPSWKAKMMACLMALYQDQTVAEDAYEAILADAVDFFAETKGEGILDQGGV